MLFFADFWQGNWCSYFMSPILDSKEIRQKLVVVSLSPRIEMENLPSLNLVVNPRKARCPKLEKRKKNMSVEKNFSLKCGVFPDLSREFIEMLGSLKTKMWRAPFS